MVFMPGKRGEKHRLSDFNAVYYCIIARTVCQPSFFKKGKKFSRPCAVARENIYNEGKAGGKGRRREGFFAFAAIGYGVSEKDMI